MDRNRALDGVRGLAALAVVLSHCVLAVSGHEIWATTIRNFGSLDASALTQRLLYVLFPGEAAVTLFFVLSGHVLWGSFARRRPGSVAAFRAYVAARLYRLMPVAVVSALPLGFLVQASARDLAAAMLLLDNRLNGVLWSLQVELLCSLALFPVWLVTRGSWRRLAALLVLAFVAASWIRVSPVMFFPAFLMGALIGSVPERIWRSRLLLWAGLAALVLASFFSHSFRSRYVEMAGAMALVGCIGVAPLRVLKSRVVQFLGAVSYPLYLCQTVGLTVAAGIVLPAQSASPFSAILAMMAITLAVALPLAFLIHVTVEIPFLTARPSWRWPAGWSFAPLKRARAGSDDPAAV